MTITTLKSNFALMVLNTAGNVTSAFSHFQGVVNLSSSSKCVAINCLACIYVAIHIGIHIQ